VNNDPGLAFMVDPDLEFFNDFRADNGGFHGCGICTSWNLEGNQKQESKKIHYRAARQPPPQGYRISVPIGGWQAVRSLLRLKLRWRSNPIYTYLHHNSPPFPMGLRKIFVDYQKTLYDFPDRSFTGQEIILC
jgi:hypothetical protein